MTGAVEPLTSTAGERARIRSRRLIDGLDRNAEDVTHAALGADVARSSRVELDLAAQAHDLHVDGTVVHLIAVQPREIQQLIAAEDAVRSAEQHHEQTELALA